MEAEPLRDMTKFELETPALKKLYYACFRWIADQRLIQERIERDGRDVL